MSAEALPDPLAAAAALSGPGVTQPSLSGAGRRFISDIVVELGFVSPEVAEQAVEAGRRPGTTPEKVLLDSGALSEDELARALAERYALDHIDLSEFPVDSSAAGVLREAAARRYQAAPVGFTSDGTLIVAVADPADSLGLSDIAVMTKLPVRPAVASRSQLEALVNELQFMEEPAPTGPETIGTVIVPPDDDEADERTKTLRIAPPSAAVTHADDPRHEQLERELEAARQALAAAEAGHHETLVAARAEHERALAEARARHASELEALAAKHAAELGELRAAIETAGHATDEVRAELERTRSQLAEVDAGLAAAGAELELLEGADRRAENARAALAELRDESERQAELHSLIEREQKGELIRAREENRRLGAELKDLQDNVADATRALAAMGSAERRLNDIAERLSNAPPAPEPS